MEGVGVAENRRARRTGEPIHRQVDWTRRFPHSVDVRPCSCLPLRGPAQVTRAAISGVEQAPWLARIPVIVAECSRQQGCFTQQRALISTA